MSSAYGSIVAPQFDSSKISSILPICKETKSGMLIEIAMVNNNSPIPLISHLHQIFSKVIEEGTSYPQEFELDEQEFREYFLSHHAFVALKAKDKSTNGVVWDERVVGMFYIKPNYPGRCSHICNGGFIVPHKSRNLGVGKAMGEAFLQLAPAIGYKSSVFNLVFANNVASVNLWKSLNFVEIGRVPKAARLQGYEELVEAIVFYKDFETDV
ncbi:601_t:CDS:2 [Ambispora gerdemannii]|uniref:601_t:CDS:1 n=1 Tax=Ambispora gerdemannii TaxID=144530 RepID=A0A9N8Z4B8_9GLOM|nr:601_t:CDS:2 [Ambispora gerdemannii]